VIDLEPEGPSFSPRVYMCILHVCVDVFYICRCILPSLCFFFHLTQAVSVWYHGSNSNLSVIGSLDQIIVVCG